MYMRYFDNLLFVLVKKNQLEINGCLQLPGPFCCCFVKKKEFDISC